MAHFTIIEAVTVYYVQVIEADDIEAAEYASVEVDLSGPVTFDNMPEKLDLGRLHDGMNVIAGDYFNDPNVTTNC